jgi:acyl carrier protein
MTQVAILRQFFGVKGTLQDFLAELKKLTPEEKLELSSLAAVELKVELTEK